jgi:hypothetical protein
MAVHGYVRATEDIDCAVVAGDPQSLFLAVEEWVPDGFSVAKEYADDADPLGGVASIEGPGIERIDLVNFFNPANPRKTPAARAIEHARPEPTMNGLRIATPEHLIALKLYAGSLADLGDAQRLAEVVEEIDWPLVEALAEEFDLDEPLELLRQHLR